MQIAVIQFPGSNCERETALAIRRAGMMPIDFLWNESAEKLVGLDGYVIVGGFSYEDRARAGVIASLDPIMQVLATQAEKGKPILGICNGAQILVEAGLVPGVENNKLAMALTENRRVANGKIVGIGYYNQWVMMRLSDHYQRNAFTRHLTTNRVLRVPVAHAEGRFVMAEALYTEIHAQGLDVFQYCNEQGDIVNHFPINPNGSMGNIAAISNKAGNVMAMMPHPERTEAGDVIFQSMRDYLQEEKTPISVPPLNYYPRRVMPTVYRKPMTAHECVVALSIADNQALTVQQALRQRGLQVDVRCYTHWEICCDDAETMLKIRQSEELFNPRKAYEVDDVFSQEGVFSFLVRAKDDTLGQQKAQTLKDYFNIDCIQAITHGVIWQFSGDAGSLNELSEAILQTNIIRNPYAHDCYRYA